MDKLIVKNYIYKDTEYDRWCVQWGYVNALGLYQVYDIELHSDGLAATQAYLNQYRRQSVEMALAYLRGRRKFVKKGLVI